jgi:hypothetical protein
MNKIITIPAIFSRMIPKVDKSWKLEILTRELHGDDIRILAERLGSEGYWANKPNAIVEADMPPGEADAGLEGKSPSQRLRSVLWVLWDQRGRPNKSFELWYASRIEQLIETVKEQLDD